MKPAVHQGLGGILSESLGILFQSLGYHILYGVEASICLVLVQSCKLRGRSDNSWAYVKSLSRLDLRLPGKLKIFASFSHLLQSAFASHPSHVHSS